MMQDDLRTLFHPLVAEWFDSKFPAPTDAQARTWPLIEGGSHVLLCSPTGSGKTLTAFLVAIDRVIRGEWPEGGTKILYVSPLKALNNDVRRNLLSPIAELESLFAARGIPFPGVSVMTRSGDTQADERRRMLRRPPDILITTPESLNLMLTSKGGRGMLGGIRVLILDEIHAIAGGKRGAQLTLSVERLALLSGEFQRVGLSATVSPPELIAAWMGGFSQENGARSPRKVTVVESRDRREIELTVRTIAPAGPTPGPVPKAEGGEARDAFWDAIANDLVKQAKEATSLIVFANSRRVAEKVARLMNEAAGELLAYPHHGSLSRELRLDVEERLKAGELKAIVATSSLELGIDVGAVDRVVMVGAPKSVSSALQRAGRAGHAVGDVSVAEILPTHGVDAIYAAVVSRLATERSVERVKPAERALDVLAQCLLSMLCAEAWKPDDLYAFARCAWPYRDLSRGFFDATLAMLSGEYEGLPVRELRARVASEKGTSALRAREGSDFLVYQSGGTIPDRGYFRLRTSGDMAVIGELDEEFVWERNLGDQIALGTGAWKIVRITQNDVEVVPADPTRAMIPFWKAEEAGADGYVSRAVAEFLDRADGSLDDPDFPARIASESSLAPEATEGLVRFLRSQRRVTGKGLPGSRRIVAEILANPAAAVPSKGGKREADARASGPYGSSNDTKQMVIHTFWGGKVNKPFAIALSAAHEEAHGVPLAHFAGNESILLEVPADGTDACEAVTRSVTSGNLERLLRKGLEGTPLFGAKFRECAGRALLLPKADARKRFPLWLNRLRSARLLEAVKDRGDFPVILEAWRECLEDEFDLEALKSALDRLADGSIAVETCVTQVPSPFAEGVAWRQTNYHMYREDANAGREGTAMGDDVFRELLADASLRPPVDAASALELEAKLSRFHPGYAPETDLDLAAALAEAGFYTESEWERLVAARLAASHESPREPETIPAMGVRLRHPGAAEAIVASPGSAHALAHALGLRENGAETDETGEDADPEGERESALAAWLARKGPVSPEAATATFGWTAAETLAALESLAARGEAVAGNLIAGNPEFLFCDSENYERLLRIRRSRSRASFEPVDPSLLGPFLARWQVGNRDADPLEALKDSVAPLFGYPLQAALWEGAAFPARVAAYHPALLDSLFSGSGLSWYGCGKGIIALATGAELRASVQREKPSGKAAAFLEAIGTGTDLLDAARAVGLASAEATEAAWECAWAGLAASDSFEDVRRGIASSFKAAAGEGGARPGRGGFRSWERSRPLAGKWFALPRAEADDPMDAALGERRLALTLLARYGVVFREILANEASDVSWSRCFKTLRLMELSGEVVAGRFFSGTGGIQFATREAAEALRALASGGEAEARPLWINACDPASPCGLGFGQGAGLGGLPPPRRIPTTWIAYSGASLALVARSNGADVDIAPPPRSPSLPAAMSLFRYLASRPESGGQVAVATVNGESALESPYLGDFLAAGFERGMKTLSLYRSYR